MQAPTETPGSASSSPAGDGPQSAKVDLQSTSGRWLTVPNAICVLRLCLAPVLLLLAVWNQPVAFLGLYVFLAFTDWVDGKLAIILNQRSEIGPRLDTVSDVAMYSGLLGGAVWLHADFLRNEAGWVTAMVATYALTVSISLAKFRAFPSYHTRAAKIAWFLTLVAIVSLFLEWSPWPFRIAAAMVVLANIETSLMSLMLKRKQSDVPTLLHALARERSNSASRG